MSVTSRSGLLLALTAGFLLMLFSQGLGEDTVRGAISIIAHPSVPVNAITRDTLKKIYAGHQVVWDDGRPVKPALLAEGEIHTRFVTSYIDKTPSQFQTYWRKMAFTGQGVSPATFDNEQKLVEYVAGTEGAIGYVSSSTQAAKTRTLQITEK